jgi:hypothetical protein
MSVEGQYAKSSLRADVFRFAPNIGRYSQRWPTSITALVVSNTTLKDGWRESRVQKKRSGHLSPCAAPSFMGFAKLLIVPYHALEL